MRRQRMKNVLAAFAAVLSVGILTGGTLALFAEPVLAENTGNVYDNAGIFSEEEISEIDAALETVSGETGWNMIAVTTDDAEGKTSEAYADDVYDGIFGIDTDGIAVLIDMDNRTYYISTSGEAVYYLTDSRIDSIIDDAYSDMADGEYGQACVTMVQETFLWYKEGIPSNQNTYDRETGKTTYYHSRMRLTLAELLIALVAGIAAGAIVIGIITGKYRLKWVTYQYDYHTNGRVALTNERDDFVNQMVTHHRIQTDNGGGSHGSSGRSTVHTSSSGGHHGGGGRKF